MPVSESEVELVAEAAPSDCPGRRPSLQRLSAPHVVGGSSAASKIPEEEATSSGAMSPIKVVSIDALNTGSGGDSRAPIGEGANDGIMRSPNGGGTSQLPSEEAEAAVLVVDASAASESHQLNSGFAEWRWAIEEGEGSSAAAAQTSLKPSSSEAMVAPAELQKRLQECVNLMDRAYTALTLSDKVRLALQVMMMMMMMMTMMMVTVIVMVMVMMMIMMMMRVRMRVRVMVTMTMTMMMMTVMRMMMVVVVVVVVVVVTMMESAQVSADRSRSRFGSFRRIQILPSSFFSRLVPIRLPPPPSPPPVCCP